MPIGADLAARADDGGPSILLTSQTPAQPDLFDLVPAGEPL
jgi:hypothetical protein